MIATGTDIRPWSAGKFCDAKSQCYWLNEKVVGYHERAAFEELALMAHLLAKSNHHFVIIDAIGVEKSQKTDSRP